MTHRPLWTFDRSDRLAALIDAHRRLANDLFRERCDTPTGPDRAALDARLALVNARLARLCAVRRAENRTRRLALVGAA